MGHSVKKSVSPVIIITGKLSIVFCCFFIFVKVQGFELLYYNPDVEIIGRIFAAAGLLFVITGIVSLGRSISVGLPSEKTKLKTKGLFSITRNPIYLGSYLLCLGSCLIFLHLVNIFLFLTVIFIHHRIVLSEEKYLEQTFGNDWVVYKQKVPRYILIK